MPACSWAASSSSLGRALCEGAAGRADADADLGCVVAAGGLGWALNSSRTSGGFMLVIWRLVVWRLREGTVKVVEIILVGIGSGLDLLYRLVGHIEGLWIFTDF
jgi:hypothetical protein